MINHENNYDQPQSLSITIMINHNDNDHNDNDHDDNDHNDHDHDNNDNYNEMIPVLLGLKMELVLL